MPKDTEREFPDRESPGYRAAAERFAAGNETQRANMRRRFEEEYLRARTLNGLAKIGLQDIELELLNDPSENPQDPLSLDPVDPDEAYHR